MLSPTWSQNNEQSNKGPWLLLAYETYLLKNFDFSSNRVPCLHGSDSDLPSVSLAMYHDIFCHGKVRQERGIS